MRRIAPLAARLPVAPNPPRAAANSSPATRQLARTTVRPNRTIALTYSLEQPVQEFVAFEAGVVGDLSEDGVQRADL